MKVAIVGGGLFGCTSAVHLARAGHEVHLFEKAPTLMSGASAGTFARLHRGAHYPRSPETGRESRRAENGFRVEYGGAVIDGGRQIYVVPCDTRSHVTPDEFRAFLDDEGIAFAEENGAFEVIEPRVNLSGLAALVRSRVRDARVNVHLNAQAHAKMRDAFDRIVVAAYAGSNDVLFTLGLSPQLYKFQVIERPIVLLPSAFRNMSVVVVDGPFGCVDPLDDTPLHMMGHVSGSVHAETVSETAYVPDHLSAFIDAGLIRKPPVTRWRRMADSLAEFVPGIEAAQYVGSSFVVRAVLAGVEATDARPTLVERLDGQVIRVFSGKLGTAVRAAERVVGMVEREAIAA